MKRIILVIVLAVLSGISKPEPKAPMGINLVSEPDAVTCLRYGVCPTDVR